MLKSNTQSYIKHIATKRIKNVLRGAKLHVTYLTVPFSKETARVTF